MTVVPKFDQKYVQGRNVKENEKSAEIQSLHHIFLSGCTRKRQKITSLSVPTTTAILEPLTKTLHFSDSFLPIFFADLPKSFNAN